MPRYKFSRAGTWDYPTLGVRATQNDVIESSSAPDAYWDLVDPATPTTLPPPAVPVPLYTETPDGAPLVYDAASNSFKPSAAPLTGSSTPAKLLAPYQGIYSPVPVIVLRIDDSWPVDRTLADAMTARGLVGGFCTISSVIDTAGRLTTADLKAMQLAGHEIVCHTRTHGSGPASMAAFTAEAVDSAADLRAKNLAVQCFAQPGTWDANGAYWLDTLDKLDSQSGKLLRANYAASMGYIGDGITLGARPMPAPVQYGYNHATWETGSGIATPQAFVEKVIAYGGIGEILTHGFKLDTAGFLTSADYLAFLDWLAAQRDAGRVNVMTPTAAAYVQRGTRVNLAADPSFETLAATPANSPWQLKGLAAIFATGRTGNAVEVKSTGTGDAVQLTIDGLATLRSIEVGGYVKAKFTGGQGRIVFQQLDKTQALLDQTNYVAAASSTSAWNYVRTNIGIRPDAVSAKMWFSASTQHCYWDDVAIYRT